MIVKNNLWEFIFKEEFHSKQKQCTTISSFIKIYIEKSESQKASTSLKMKIDPDEQKLAT